MSDDSGEILVVGAGPTGLALALQARAHGARVRVVDRREGPRPSRALVVHPRTVEQLRPLGVVDELRDRADTDPAALLHLRTREVPVRLGALRLTDSPIEHLWMIRQQDVEDTLGEALARHGVPVERGRELVALDGDGHGGCHPVLRTPAGRQEPAAGSWVVGCDGAGSTVRALAGIRVRSRPYRQEILLADVELAAGPVPGIAHVAAGRDGLVFVFALGERASWRVLATRPAADPARTGTDEPPGAPELQRLLDANGFRVRITAVAWSERVRLRRRLADHFRRGSVFLAGDAAHTHSPAAAQGMNLGLQDALNLGWKLALASSSTRPEALLDSYEAERRPVARASIALTDLVFWAESSTSPPAAVLRSVLAPAAAPLLPALLRQRAITGPALRLLAGMRLRHRHSPLSHDDAPRRRSVLHAGDRIPDDRVITRDGAISLHELLARPGIHVLVARDAPELQPDTVGTRVVVHRLLDRPGTALVAVRPDGYIGYIGMERARLRSWLSTVGALGECA